MADPKVKFFFLVAGFEYSGKGLDFDHMCTGRVWERCTFLNDSLTAKDPLISDDTTLRFLRFNFGTGKIEVIERQFVKGKGVKTAFAQESDWKPLTSIGGGDAFDPATFVAKGPFRAISKTTDYVNQSAEYPNLDQSVDKPDIVSITDVYQSVRDAPSQSVIELSFFSHGWIEGPVLVNSQNRTGTSTLRDPRDKDGRATLDFNLNMGINGTPASLRNIFDFFASFDPKGFMQTWGCNFDIDLRVLATTIQAMAKAKAAGKAFADDTAIEFEFEGWQPDRYRGADPAGAFFPAT